MPTVYFQDAQKYFETGGHNYKTIGSGRVRFTLDDSVEIPFLWWTPKTNDHSPITKWWENMPGITSEENLPYLLQLDFLQFSPKGLSNIYYLIVPDIERSPFSSPEIQQVEPNTKKSLDLPSYNPAADPYTTFSKLFAPNCELAWDSIRPDRSNIWGLINFLKARDENPVNSYPEGSSSTVTSSCLSDIPDPGDPIISDPGDPIISDPGDPIISNPGDPIISDPGDPIISDPGGSQTVPEYSSILTIAIFGIVFCSRLFKRKLR